MERINTRELRKIAKEARERIEQEKKNRETFLLKSSSSEAKAITEKVLKDLPNKALQAAKNGNDEVIVYSASSGHAEVGSQVYGEQLALRKLRSKLTREGYKTKCSLSPQGNIKYLSLCFSDKY